MLYVDEKLVNHPKIYRAGSRLGPNGPAQALALFMAGLTYAREHLTDGFIPREYVQSCGLVTTPASVAQVLSSKGVKLWHRAPGGYQIHDYHRWNKKASEIKEKREHERLKKAAYRAALAGGAKAMSRHVSPGDKSWTSRARASTNHDPLNTKIKSTDAPRRLAKQHPVENPSFALSCIVMREAVDRSWRLDQNTGFSNTAEHFKTLMAQRQLAYDADLVRKAYDAVTVAAVLRKRA